MITKEFPTEVLQELAGGDEPDGYSILSNELVDTSRWSTHHALVFMHQGERWRTSYRCGATECQDEYPFEYEGETVTCRRVVPVEKVVVVYEDAPE